MSFEPSNLPPGVTVNMIPGCGPDYYEAVFDAIEDDVNEAGLNPDEVMLAWQMGLEALKIAQANDMRRVSSDEQVLYKAEVHEMEEATEYLQAELAKARAQLKTERADAEQRLKRLQDECFMLQHQNS